MIPNEEFLLGSASPRPASASHAASARLPGWTRPSVQWLGVVLAHGAAIALLLQVSPQARSALGRVVQASLIAPRPLPVAPPAPEPQARPPEPKVKPPEPPPKPPEPRRKPVKAPQPRPAPQPAPVLSAVPRDEAPPASFVVEAAAAAPAPAPAPVESAPAASTATAAPAPPPPVTPPVYNADYLDNPPPKYPPISRRLGEQGRVLLHVRVSADGRAERIDIRTSSGFERLDQAARAAVAGWRFMPARRGEEPTAAWVLIPVSFVM